MPRPPRLAKLLVRLFAFRERDDAYLGDIEEIFAEKAATRGPLRSRAWYWREALGSLPACLGNTLVWSWIMFTTNLKIAVRNLKKHLGYSGLNIAGLALGIACALFILLWVQDELSFDRFHANAKTLYQIEQDQKMGQGVFHHSSTPYGMREALITEIPEIKDASRFFGGRTLLIRQGEKAFFENGVVAVDSSFLEMFSFPVIRGDAETALADPGSVVLTESLATKYFGADDPIGRTLTLNNRFPVTVSAVTKDIPSASSLQFDALLPMEFLKNLNIDINNWEGNESPTYVQLRENSSVVAINAKLTHMIRGRWQNSAVGLNMMLRPIVDMRLHGYFGFDHSNQTVKTVTAFSLIGLFVLLTACVNFMNLATARSANRAREVGLRKVVGAYRRGLAGQFLGESILTALLAGLISLLLVVAFLPAFNSVAGKTMTLASLFSLKFALSILAVAALTGIIAGSYPALVLSSFQPVQVLKGRSADGARGAWLRKVLVVTQFSLSIFLLIGMAVAVRQIGSMRNRSLGYDKDQLIYLPLRGETGRSYATLKERLLRDSRIQGVTGTAQQPSQIGNNSWGADWDGKNPNERYLVGWEFVDYDYPETMKIQMASGRSFDRAHATDEKTAFIVNETMAKLMGLDAETAVGKRLHFVDIDGVIIGVMRDFHFQSVRNSILPLAVSMRNPAETHRAITHAVVRLKAGDIPGSIQSVEKAWREINAEYPFVYRFFDQDFDQMYRADEQTGVILKIFAGLAVVIACLGLFGLASFTAEQRTKEIGVRKVLGASPAGIVVLLSKEFAKWVLLANVLAWPLAFFVMRGWLRQFAYKMPISWWIFAAAGAGALLVALPTVSLQALRAARANPVEALKYE
jgi:putative ABC transport system permease protein